MDDMDKPVLNQQQLFEYLRYEEGLTSVTRSSIKWAVIRREIVPTRIGNGHYFSKRDGLKWIESCRVPPKTHTQQPVLTQ